MKQRKQLEEDSYDIFSEQEQPKQQSNKKNNATFEDGQYLIDLSSKKRVCISKFKGSVMVSLREYFEKDGQLLPTKKGITLNLDNWNKFKEYIGEIDECIKKIK